MTPKKTASVASRKYLNTKLFLVFSLFIFVFLITEETSFAAIRTSTATGGNWSTTSTWIGGVVPGNADSAIIATTGGNSVTIGAGITNAGLTINAGGILDITGAFTITENGNVAVNGTLNGATGILKMNANPLTIDGNGTINSKITVQQPTSVAATANLTTTAIITLANTLTINAGGILNTIEIDSNAKTVINNGTVNLSGNYFRTGGTAIWTQGTNAVVNIGGAFTPVGNITLNATAAGNTVNYNGAAQSPKPTTYTNLILSGSDVKSISSGTSVSGNVSIAPTGSATASIAAGLNMSVGTLTLGGLGRINGTWGSSSSAATYQNNTYFATTTGILTVTTDTRGAQATLTAVATPSVVPYGSTSTLSSTGGSGTGAVTFYAGASTGCTVLSTTLSVTNINGTCDITATKAADTSYLSTTSAPLSVTLTAAATAQLFSTGPSTMMAGTRSAFSVTRKDQYGNLKTAGSETFYLYSNSSGSTKRFYDAASAGNIITAVTIQNGTSTGQFWYYDELAGTALITTSDNATAPDGNIGIKDATSTIAITASTPAQFSLNTQTSMTAGTRLNYTVTRKDSFGNLVTAVTSTAYLYSNSTGATKKFYDAASGGNIITSIAIQSGTSSANFWYYDELATNATITASDNAVAPDGNTGIIDAASAITITPATVGKFILNNPGNMTAGTRLGYVVTREDVFGNMVTTGSNTAYLYSNSTGATKKFYDAASGGNIITAIPIASGASSANFWYYDEQVGSWTVTASDNAVAPDGATGIIDSTANVTVNAAPIVATRITIVKPTDSVVGTAIAVTVRAEDNSGNLDTTYNNNMDITLRTSGAATPQNGVVLNIINGVGNVNVTDTIAETITLSLTATASTTLDVSSTQTVTFTIGPTAQFILSNPGNMTAGTRLGYVVTRKDNYGNLVTTGIDMVHLYTNATGGLGTFYDAASGGNIITAIAIQGGASSASLWYYDGKAGTWTVTASDNAVAPDGATGIADATRTVVVSPGTTSQFTIDNPGNMFAGSRLGYTVTRKDSFGNLVTSGNTTFYMYSSANSASTAFYNAATGGSIITSRTIMSGASTAEFWYYEERGGIWTVTASDNAVAPDGATGIADASVAVTVSNVPIVATRFTILKPADTQVNTNITVTVRAEDNSGNLDTTYNNTVTLVTSGSATGGGLITIQNGIGTKTITDAVAETVVLSLLDTASTTLDVSSAQSVLFSLQPILVTGGAQPSFGLTRATVIFSGTAFPGAKLTIIGTTNGDVPVRQGTTARADGTFSIRFSDLTPGISAYFLSVIDKEGRLTQTKTYSVNANQPLVVRNVFLPPTIGFAQSAILKGGFLGIKGYATPGATIVATIDGREITPQTTARDSGEYLLPFNTIDLALGTHTARTIQINGDGTRSDSSIERNFLITNLFVPQTDLNGDGVVNASDLSIFLAKWLSKDETTRKSLDFNGDGNIDIQDLSIFARTLGK